MALWRLASSSLLVVTSKSFVLPPAPTAPQQAPSRAAAARRSSSCAHDVCGPAAVRKPGPASGRGTTSTPRRTALRRLNAAGETNDEDAIDGWDGNLDALDAQLRREDGAAPQASSAAGDFDDGFGALDDLLGLDDSASPRAPRAATEGNGAVDIDPFAKLDAPVVTDSLDDLLSELQPRGAQHSSPAATTERSRPTAGRSTPTTPPASADVSDSWLDDLLNVDSEDLESSSPRSSASGILESLIDDVTVVGDGPRAAGDTTASTTSGLKTEAAPASASMPADAPAALDDWLNELLQDGEEQSGSSSKSAVPEMPPFQQSQARGSETQTSLEASLDDDPWAFAADNSGGEEEVGGSYGDVITGSNQLEGWKTNTGSTAASPKRSNVMGRARKTVADSDGVGDSASAEERSRPWDPEGEEGNGRTSDWGEGDAWGRKGDSSGPSWWDKDGPGMGMEEATGRRPVREEKRALDPIEEAQRACAADLKKLGQRGQWEDATRALVGARVRGVPVNVYMYNSAISAVSKAGRWKEALSMMEQMEKDGIAFDEFTYSAAIVACGKGGKPRKALELLDEMVKVHGIAPDIICYGAAIQACGDAGLSDEALSLMRRMSGDGLLPDKTAYNSAIIACGEKGQWEKALELLGEMRTGGLRPDQNSYRFAMKACGVGGRWERAVLLLHEMEEDGSTPDAAAFQAALDVLKDAAQWERAMDVISEMDELGVPPTESCFSSAIAACSEVGEWLPASKARKLMGYYGLQPELETYKSIIKACLVGREFNMALTTLFDLQKSGKRADQETWDMLIELCAAVGKWDAALEIIRDIFAEEVWFDMTAIRARFFDCPSEDIKMKALTIIAMEARTAPSMKRKKMNNIRAATKRKPGYRAPEKAPTRRKKSKGKSGGKPGNDAMPKEFADLSLE